MKALSQTQITRCEASKRPRCKCRCKGALHGIRQGTLVQQTMFHPLPPEQQHLRPGEKAA